MEHISNLAYLLKIWYDLRQPTLTMGEQNRILSAINIIIEVETKLKKSNPKKGETK